MGVKKNEEKLLIKKELFSISGVDIDDIKFHPNGMSSFIMDIIVKRFQDLNLKENFLETYDWFQIRCEHYWEDVTYYIDGYRYETDQEFKDRLEKSKKASEAAKKAAKKRAETQKKLAEDRDRREYERLKKKFEGK